MSLAQELLMQALAEIRWREHAGRSPEQVAVELTEGSSDRWLRRMPGRDEPVWR
jgi:hypothetical protein